MVVSHLHLVFNGKTTVESYAGRDQAEMENSALHREFGFVLRDHEKRMVRRKWKEEFGGVEVDDRWRFGTWKERWRQEMGNGWLGWIGKSRPFPALRSRSSHWAPFGRRTAFPFASCLWTEWRMDEEERLGSLMLVVHVFHRCIRLCRSDHKGEYLQRRKICFATRS
jgi:hypothetical protein